MREDQIQAAATDVLAAIEREARHGIEAAYAAVLARAGTPAGIVRDPSRRRRWFGAAAAVAFVGAAGLVVALVAHDDDTGRVRTGPAASTPAQPTAPAATSPATTAPQTTIPASTAPASAVTPALPADPFGAALSAAATPAGLLLGQPDGTWTPTPLTEPLTGPAYLVGRFVAQQDADPSLVGSTSGPIRIVTDADARVWDTPGPQTDPSGADRYRLLDAGLVGGQPSMLVGESDRDAPDAADSRLLIVVLADGSITDLGNFGGWESGVLAAGIGTDRLAVLHHAGTSNWVEIVGLDGASLFRHDLTTDMSWSLAVEETTAWAFGVRSRTINTFLGPELEYFVEVIELDLQALAVEPREVVLPGYEDRQPCAWMRFDGRSLACTTDLGPLASAGGMLRRYPELPGGIVTNRRGTPPTDAQVVVDGYRPYVDPSICPPVAARTSPAGGEFDWQPFAMSAGGFASYQFIGDPVERAGGPFAMVGLHVLPENHLAGASRELTETNGWEVSISAREEAGYADAVIQLPDGSQAYVRTYGFTRALIESVIGALALRPTDAPIPGFDYDPALGPTGMEMIHEQLPAPVRPGTTNRLLCSQGSEPVPNGGTYTRDYSFTAIEGDPLYQFLSVLDRPYPLEVGSRGDAVIILHGLDLPGRPTVADVVDAPAERWDDLLAGPWPPGQL